MSNNSSPSSDKCWLWEGILQSQSNKDWQSQQTTSTSSRATYASIFNTDGCCNIASRSFSNINCSVEKEEG